MNTICRSIHVWLNENSLGNTVYVTHISKSVIPSRNLILTEIKDTYFFYVFSGVLCPGTGLQTEVHWSSSEIQWVVIQVYCGWERENGSFKESTDMYHPCFSGYVSLPSIQSCSLLILQHIQPMGHMGIDSLERQQSSSCLFGSSDPDIHPSTMHHQCIMPL